MLRYSRPVLSLLWALAVCPAGAQIQRLELEFTGVNCEPCLESLPARAKRVRGVEDASLTAARNVLALTMAPINRVRVEQFRDLIEQDGTKAVRATRIEVRGVLGAKGATLSLPGHALPFSLDWADVATGSARPNAAAAPLEDGAAVTLTGTIPTLKSPVPGAGLRIHVKNAGVLR